MPNTRLQEKYKREAEAIAKKQIADRARMAAEAEQAHEAEEASKLRTRAQNMSGCGQPRGHHYKIH